MMCAGHCPAPASAVLSARALPASSPACQAQQPATRTHLVCRTLLLLLWGPSVATPAPHATPCWNVMVASFPDATAFALDRALLASAHDSTPAASNTLMMRGDGGEDAIIRSVRGPLGLHAREN